MIFERYVDIAVGENEFVENIRIETDIPEGEIYTISPMMTKYGAKYKNISLIEDRYGNQFKVKGNYKDMILSIRGDRTKINGFKKY